MTGVSLVFTGMLTPNYAQLVSDTEKLAVSMRVRIGRY